MTMFSSTKLFAAGLAALALAGSAWAAQSPKALPGVAGGLWELSGITGARTPVRQCVLDPISLAFVEHHSGGCTSSILSDSANGMRVGYQCKDGGFGQATIKTVTPRSLRIDVQGIAAGAPYGYVVQAHRIGDCPSKTERGRGH